ncbi:acyl-CoA carboxylase epsilon subunit [Microbispora sp. H10836]|uniref:acyl-CoA carboxylase epsilon subunit n=1 Tax=Microbispora sp. H10836 TaxID=2729106 RepID=UPI0028935C02|nr:acyl-CoA carboxylase epsilon subunit [Microbispora sp. H10836]
MIQGAPSPEELAALAVALLAARQTGPAAPSASSGWCVLARRHAMRRPLATGPQGWRESRWSLGGRL